MKSTIIGPALALIVVLALTGCGQSAKERQAQAEQAEKAKATAAASAAHSKELEATAKKKTSEGIAAKFAGLASARAESGYVAVLYENGRKGMFPSASLTEEEIAWLNAFALAHPLAHGKSTVVTAKTEVTKTMEKQLTENGVETVQLRSPAKLRDQIGGTCMLYGRVHYLDIAGYPVEDVEIYRVINNVPTNQPYLDYHYYVGMLMLFLHQKPSPTVHFPNGTISSFEWARQELRKGRPILSALPEDIWMSLPAEFLATHPFDGNSKIGHQVVINGFTYNPATQKGTFHVVNSWRVLAEFDVPVDKSDERRILMEQSLSPRGEPPEAAAKVTAGVITVIKPVGKKNLYAVETNLGTQRVVATTEEDAKAFVEADTSAKDLDTVFGEYIIRIYDYIYDTADPKIRDTAAALLLSEIFKIPETIAVPHVDLEVKSSLGKVYFVRLSPNRVVKMFAESTGDALDKARKLPPGPRS
jgi:hypothetical protein